MDLVAAGVLGFGLVLGFLSALFRRSSLPLRLALSAGYVAGGALVALFAPRASLLWYVLGFALGVLPLFRPLTATGGRIEGMPGSRPRSGSLARGGTTAPGAKPTRPPVATMDGGTGSETGGGSGGIPADGVEGGGIEESRFPPRVRRPFLRSRHRPTVLKAAEARHPEGPPRYANAALLEETLEFRLSRSAPLPPGQVFRIRLDIGKLSRESQVERQEPFPEHALPDADVWIDAMLSSSHFQVSAERQHLGKSTVASGRFFLPKGGGPARTEQGEKYLYFFLRAPESPGKGLRARLAYHFRGAVIQSQVLIADVGARKGGFKIETDYTIAESPTHLGAISERPRLALIANDTGGTHQVSVRAAGGDGAVVGAKSIEIDKQTLGDRIGRLRKELSSEAIAPTTRKRRKDRLINDLRVLAPLGWELWSALAAQFRDAWREVRKEPEKLVIHVARTNASSFVFPWSFIYEHFLDSTVPSQKLALCPLVERWDGHLPLFVGSPRECPEGPHQENVLCPFGFWGFRYSVEQLSSTDQPVTSIVVPADFEAVVAETQYQVEPERLTAHVGRLQKLLGREWLRESKTKDQIRLSLGKDLPLVYFYCHGERSIGRRDTFLGVGQRERISTDDFNGWLQVWDLDGKRVWDQVRPLIFINACHSLEINPDTLVSYLSTFVGSARAAGVIGTEVKVHQDLAMEFAEEFFARFIRDGWSVDQALRQVRLDFLRDGNLFGLLYTPYCWADLTLTRQPPPAPAP